MPTPEQQVKEAKFKAAFPCPEFHEAENITCLGVLPDQTGRWWALLQYPRDWMYSPYSARPTIKGTAIALALRLSWSDERPANIPNGDFRFVDQFQIEKEPLLQPLLQGKVSTPTTWIGAVNLPFPPDAVTLVDR